MSKQPTNVNYIMFDYNDIESAVEQFKNALVAFGAHVNDDPRTDGSDMYGFVVTNIPVNAEQIHDLCPSYNEE